MTRITCLSCCFLDNKVHPLENMLDIKLVPLDEHYYSDQDENFNLAVNSGKVRPLSTMTKMDSTNFGTGSARDQPNISPLHAAAVNGDKASLAKLLISHPKDVDVGDKFGRTPLMYCVLGDRMECAEMLIKANVDVNRKDIGGRTALHWAAHKGNFRCLKLLLSKGANWREKDNEGQTAMHLSTRHKSPKCLALLMKHLEVGEVDDQDKNKRTCLHWAASYGNLEHIKMLIRADSNIGIPDVDGKTPLHWAASSKDSQAVDCVQLILETTPNVINWQDYEGRTALHLAVAEGNQVVHALTTLEKCNVSALDNMFRTPLHWAAVLGHSQIVGILLDKKADYLSTDSNGATPLHYAAQNNFAQQDVFRETGTVIKELQACVEIPDEKYWVCDISLEFFTTDIYILASVEKETVEVFLQRKVRDEPDMEGRSAFMWAAGKGANDVVHSFIKYDVDISQADKTGGTVLHASALAGFASTVKLLLDNKAQINAKDQTKHTPLFRACEMGHMDVVQTLIDAGAAVDVSDQDGRSLLHWAALGGHAYICQTLIKYGIDPNVKDHSGRTPLQCAAYGGFVNCMSVLIEHRADTDSQDHEGMTALHWACSKGHLDAVKLLIELNAFPNNMEATEDRYTPLDYAFMGEHNDIGLYMVEHGGLSIRGIQEIAALKIQSTFRGYRVRKTFLERKQLLMKHEQLRKDAAKKKAEEEYKRKEDQRNKREVEDRRKQEGGDTGFAQKHEEEEVKADKPEETKHRKKKKHQHETEEAKVLRLKKEREEQVKEERARMNVHKTKTQAAVTIQRAWRRWHYMHKGMWREVKANIREKRLQAGEEEWVRQIAALTIQLAWRKYYRRKLLRSLTPKNRRILHMWDPDVIALKQRALISQVYGENIPVTDWHPKLKAPVRPTWCKFMPSPAAVSFNFAVSQYHPLVNSRHNKGRHTWANYEYLDTSDEFGQMKMSESMEPQHFSYNYY